MPAFASMMGVYIVSMVSHPLPLTPTHCQGSGSYSGSKSKPPMSRITVGVFSTASLAVSYCAVSKSRTSNGSMRANATSKSLLE